MLSAKNILVISPEPWNHIFVSKHHYAIYLRKRENRIFFLNPPTNNVKVKDTIYENVHEIDYRGFPSGLRYFPTWMQKYFIRRKFEQLQELCGVKFDIVWSFDNSVFYDFSALPHDVLKISHIVDLNQDFQTAKAATTADFCLCTTFFIQNILLRYNNKVWKIGHGYAANSLAGEFPLSDLKSGIKVGYAGNLDSMYIDWELILYVIRSNPDIRFHFAGSLNNQNKKQFLNDHENTTYIGKLNKGALEAFYNKMDLLILAYKADFFKEQLANPHKMMEYLASGKMIVATHTSEYKQLVENDLFLMANENKEFPLLFQAAVANLAYWNNEEKQVSRQAFALDNTYDKQLARIEKLIAEHVIK